MSNSIIEIDNIKIDIYDTQMTVLNICENAGIQLPRFCYHEGLKIAGNCRMCLVVLINSIDPVIACSTTYRPNLVIKTRSERVDYIRRSILEFLLLNHPLDCPICDQASECDLQDQSLLYGSSVAFTRSIGFKREVEDINFGPVMKTIMTRCILCTRCVRFVERENLDNVQGFGVVGRGVYSQISTFIKKFHLSSLSGNLIDLCPVGAITNRYLAYEERTWEYQSRESVDIFDSINSFIRVDYMDNQIIRILPKWSTHVLSHFITNEIRFSYITLNVRRFLLPSCKTRLGTVEIHVKYSWEVALILLTSIFLYSSITMLLPTYLSLNNVSNLKNILPLLSRSNVLLNNVLDMRNQYCFGQSVSALYHRVESVYLDFDIKKLLPVLYLNIGDYLDVIRHYYLGSTPNLEVYYKHSGLSYYITSFLNLCSSSCNKSMIDYTNVIFYSHYTTVLKTVNNKLLFPIFPKSTDLVTNELAISDSNCLGSSIPNSIGYLKRVLKSKNTCGMYFSSMNKSHLYLGIKLRPKILGLLEDSDYYVSTSNWELSLCGY